MRLRPFAALLSIVIAVEPTLTLAEVGASSQGSSAPPALPARAPAFPDLRPRIYVKDLEHFAELVKEDAAAEAQAQALVTRRTAALGVGGVLFAAGVIVAATGAGNEQCHSTPFPGAAAIRTCEVDPTQMLVGAGIAAASALVAAIITPKSGDLLDAINAWNTSHPDRPFEYSRGRHPMLEQVAAPTP